MPRDEAWDVPAATRRHVLDRDGHCCRICGRYTDSPALHHVRYRSEGGSNEASNLITLGFAPFEDCHLPVAHANKALWQPILTALTATPGLTGYQVLRWLATGMDAQAFGLDPQVGELAKVEWATRARFRARG